MAPTRQSASAWLLAWLLGLSLAACFGNPDTLGLPCAEDSACFDGLVCGSEGVCVEPGDDSQAAADESTSDGDPTGDGDPSTSDTMGDGDGDSSTDSGDGDPSTGDGDGDPTTGDGGDGDGDGDPTTGDGDGDGPQCGNDQVESGESCDGTDLNNKSCADFSFAGGSLSCSECTFDLTDCCYGAGQTCGVLQGECCVGNCNLITNKCG